MAGPEGPARSGAGPGTDSGWLGPKSSVWEQSGHEKFQFLCFLQCVLWFFNVFFYLYIVFLCFFNITIKNIV